MSHQPTDRAGGPSSNAASGVPAVPAEHLAYLREHRICERLESMLRHVLLQRPEDPVLAMCNHLNDVNRSGTSLRYAAAAASSNSTTPTKRAHRSQPGEDTEDAVAPPLSSGVDGVKAHGVPSASPSATAGAADNAVAVGPAAAARTAAEASASQQQHAPSSVAASPSGPTTVGMRQAPASASAGRSGGANGGMVSSPTTARAPTSMAAIADSRRGSAAAAPHSRGGSALHRLDRDDSARSDVSAFSVTSVDMAEFLADFRAAHYSLYGSSTSDISIDDLADIVDRVALPIPDTRLLSDLFVEMDTALGGVGAVPFIAFLARMNYRIAGKYHMDVVRGIFFALAKTVVTEKEALELEQRLESVDDLAALVEEDIAARSASAAASTHVSTTTSPLAVKAAHAPSTAAGGFQQHAIQPPAAATIARTGGAATASLACTTITVEVASLIDITLRGVGLRLTVQSAEDVLGRVGLTVQHQNHVVSLHILDLARFLSAATAQHAPPRTPACSIQQVPSVGCDLNDLAILEGQMQQQATA